MPAFSVSLPATIEEDGPVASWPNGQATGVFAGSTRVLTAELGLARLDSVAGGQLLMWDGAGWVPSQVRPAGRMPTYRVSLTNGQHVAMTADHRLACVTAGDEHGRNAKDV